MDVCCTSTFVVLLLLGLAALPHTSPAAKALRASARSIPASGGAMTAEISATAIQFRASSFQAFYMSIRGSSSAIAMKSTPKML